MNNKRLQFIYSPKFNEKGIIIRSLFFLIFDVIIIKLLFTYSNLKNVIFYINLRLTFTTVFYLIRMIKYFFVFIKHRLDVFIIRSNTELQDDLYKDYNLIKDLIDNSIKDIILVVEFFVLSYLFSYACSIYKSMLLDFNFSSILITNTLYILFVGLISYRMEIKYKDSEDKHNVLMFLSSSDKL